MDQNDDQASVILIRPDPQPMLSLSRWRERVGVRVVPRARVSFRQAHAFTLTRAFGAASPASGRGNSDAESQG